MRARSMHLFAYGTLLSTRLMRLLTFASFHSVAAELDGYRAFTVLGEAYPGLVKHGRSCVSGRLWLSVSGAALQRLDAFEGHSYRRARVRVRTRNGLVTAITYMFTRADRRRLTTKPWDAQAFAAHHEPAYRMRLATRGVMPRARASAR